MDGDPRTDEAIVVRDGRVKASGSAADMRRAVGAGAGDRPRRRDGDPGARRHASARDALRRARRGARRPDRRHVARRHRRAASRARAAETPTGEWIMTTPVGEPHYFIRRSWRDLAEGALPGPRRARPRDARPPGAGSRPGRRSLPTCCAFNARGLRTPRHRRARRPTRSSTCGSRRTRRASRPASCAARSPTTTRRAVHERAAAPAAAVHARAGGDRARCRRWRCTTRSASRPSTRAT